MNRHIALAAFLACLSSTAGAQTPATEALPDSYPDPQCIKPQVNMIRPGTQINSGNNAIDSGPVGSYNAKVKAFNKQAAAYDSCMHAYIDKANSDVKTIQDKANADLKQVSERANGSMKAIQDKIRQAVAEAKSVAADIDEQTARLRKQ
jgi:ElaB/YqjD/DUF883 family membrane-anchored ribosome-binding protein